MRCFITSPVVISFEEAFLSSPSALGTPGEDTEKEIDYFEGGLNYSDGFARVSSS